VIVVCLAAQLLAARPARAQMFRIFGPDSDFKGFEVVTDSVTIPSESTSVKVVEGMNGDLTIKRVVRDDRTVQVFRLVPVFTASSYKLLTPFNLETDLVLTDIYALDLNPFGSPDDIT
jgi:hypothetical protein